MSRQQVVTLGLKNLNVTGPKLSSPLTLNGNVYFSPDATYDIGAAGATRPRDLYMSGSATIGGGVALSTGGLTFVTDNTGLFFIDANTRIRSAARTMYFDEWSGGWYWRTSSTGFSTAMNLTSTGSLSFPGDLTLTGSNRKITGDFTSPGQVRIETNIANNPTAVLVAPNGTSRLSAFWCYDNSNFSSVVYAGFAAESGTAKLRFGRLGTISKPNFVFQSESVNPHTTLYDAGGMHVNGAISATSGAISGRFTLAGYDAAWMSDSAGSLGVLEVGTNSGGGAARIAFHRHGSYAAYFGLDADNMWRVGGWSMGSASYKVMLGDGWPSNGASFGINGANVGTNGVTFSNHANLYSGIYYSTSSQFLGWPSEAAYKRDVEEVCAEGALANPKLRGVRYRVLEPEWITDTPGKPPRLSWKGPRAERSYGFRVEDWQEAFPDLCVDGPGNIKAFSLTGMIPITWEALRGVHAELQALRERVNQLEHKETTWQA